MTDEHSSARTAVRRDIGFRPDLELTAPRDLGLDHHLAPACDQNEYCARNALIIALYLAWFVGAWVSYPRDKNAYAACRRYHGKAFSHQRVMQVIDELEAGNIIENQRTKPHPKSKFRSRMRLAVGLTPPSDLKSIRTLQQAAFEVVRLKDHRKSLRVYPECEFTTTIRKDILAQNEALGSIDLHLPTELRNEDGFGLYWICGSALNPIRFRTYRIFNCDWSQGGRWYGIWAQNLPPTIRASLLIDGEAIVEEDCKTLHPILIAALAGIELRHDPYDILEFDRRTAKRAFNTALNSTTRLQALSAISNQLRKSGLPGHYSHCQHLLDRLIQKSPFLSDYLCSGVGIRLQRIDGDICAKVQRMLRKKGISTLSVHDSFIVRASQRPHLLEVMTEALHEARRTLRTGNFD